MNETLRTLWDAMLRWLEYSHGVNGAGAGEGTEVQLETPNAWSSETLLVFGIVAVAFVVWIYLREGAANKFWKLSLAAVRLALIALIVFMIFQPRLSLQRTRLPNLVIAVDDSASMNETDAYENAETESLIQGKLKALELEEPTRLNQAKALLLSDRQALVKAMQRDYKVLLYSLSTTAKPRWEQKQGADELQAALAKLQPLGEQSRLGSGVRQVLKDLRGTLPSAIVLFTDGVTTEG
ncbi:MAG: VWA domain-containing protein, partial [Planctomycetales bacterium]